MKTLRLDSLLIILTLLLASPAQAKILWHWEDDFDADEQQQLTQWIETTVAGIETLVAPYPFDVHIFFHRRKAREPVPWAHTKRFGAQAVHFYVDTRYPPAAFLADWTAPHELSHLLIPFVGRSHSWFSEGFASYMQYRVMHAMGILSKTEMDDKYRSHIERADRRYERDDMPFIAAAPKLLRDHEYPTLYWGGAVYFLQVDKALQAKDSSFIEVLRAYVNCCRNRSTDLKHLITRFDSLSSSTVFSSLLQVLTDKPGFPAYPGHF